MPLRNAEGTITHHVGMQTFSLVKDQEHTVGGGHMGHAVQKMGGLTGTFGQASSAGRHTMRHIPHNSSSTSMRRTLMQT